MTQFIGNKPVQQEWKKLGLTGGPGGGKSTMLAILKQKLEELGYVVLIVSEAATDCLQDNITPALFGAHFQPLLMRNALEREKLRSDALALLPGDRKILILDRTPHDAAAYMPADEYRETVESLGHTVQELRDTWCDGIIFLVSPAVDKPEVYTTTTNRMRHESVEQAKIQDRKSQDIWIGCPHFRLIDNSTDMEGKALRVLQAVYRILGIPEPLEIERKYLIGSFAFEDLPEHRQVIDIEQTYLESAREGHAERVRKRGQHGSWSYYHTIKRDIRPGVRSEIERIVSKEEYDELLLRVSPNSSTIRKQRICFVWENQYCELDVFQDLDLVLFEIELTTEQDTIIIPPFLRDVLDVTDDPYYTNSAIAHRMVSCA